MSFSALYRSGTITGITGEADSRKEFLTLPRLVLRQSQEKLIDQISEEISEDAGQKNAGLKAVTLIATLNPVSQVLW